MADDAVKSDFHAHLVQVEADLFRAEYTGELNPENPDARRLPDSHIGTDAASVKLWVEQMATSMGYTRVVWDTLP